MDKEKAVYVEALFQRIAQNYDAGNRRISLGLQGKWKKTLIRKMAARTRRHTRVLDVCCGTGDIALGLSKRRRDLQITGIDFSENMLRIAKEKREKARPARLLFLEADALHLPFADRSFSAVSVSFGLRNTEDPEAALREMLRVLKPGGSLYILDSFVPENQVIRPFYQIYFQKLMPLLGGGRRFRKEYRWLSKSTAAFYSPKQLSTILDSMGLKDLHRKSMLFGSCVLLYGHAPLDNKKEKPEGGKHE